MKALSIQQPYAFAITHGWKPVENRSWYTSYRGPFLVHAGKKELKADVDDVLEQIAAQIGRPLDEVRGYYRQSARTGGYVGAAVITDCVNRHASDWFFGPWGFVLEDAVHWHVTLPGNGALGLFNVPDDIANQMDVWLSNWKHAAALGVKVR